MGQEPGTAEEIQTFCSTTYGVTFPLLAKTDVNGADRHPLYAELTKAADADGEAGDIQWNFEKFLLAPGGDGRQAVPSAHRARRPRGDRRHRGRRCRDSPKTNGQLPPTCLQPLAHLTLRYCGRGWSN